MATQNGSKFPAFADGDVLIMLDSEQKYTLHANVLRSCSEVFNRLLTEETGAKLTAQAKNKGAHLRWRLDLKWVGNDRAEFVQKPVDSHGQTHQILSIGEILGGRRDPGLSKNFDNMLRAFYNEHLQIDGDSFMSSLQDAWALATLAEEYGAIKTVSERIDVALLRHGQSLFRAIANKPIAWMNFACTIRSELIFRNSLIHVVGQWGNLHENDKRQITPPEALAVCVRKHGEFQTLKQTIELRIAGHYPAHMQKRDETNPGRAAYANDIYPWIALSLFRHWFSQNVTDGTSFRAADGGFCFYSLIARGGRAYLDRPQLEGFHLYFPMTQKAKLVLENYLNVLKSEARQFVAPLMKNNTSFELGEGESFSYLVSLDVTEKDIPWKEQGDNEAPAVEAGPSANGS